MFIRQDSKDIEDLKQAFARIPNINILVTVYNWNDGVGDIRNAIDAYHAIKAIAPQNSVKLLAKVGTIKLQSVLNLLSYNELSSNTFIYKTQYTEGDLRDFNISHHSVILVEYDYDKQFNDDLQMKNFLNLSNDFTAFLQNTHLVFNVATEFAKLSAEISLYLPNDCQLESILEYHCRDYLEFHGQFNWKEHKKTINEREMGVKLDHIGLKLNDDLHAKAERFDHDKQSKSEVLSSLSNKVLSQLLGETDITKTTVSELDQHFNDHLLCVGYVQSHASMSAEYYLSYALLGLAENKKKLHIDVFLPSTNLEHWRELKHCCINIHHADKSVEKLGSGEITINIHPANGISNDDFEKLMLAADCVCGSGDNSISDMFSVKRLPFISVLPHKTAFMDSLIACMLEVDNSYTDSITLLRQYFSRLRYASLTTSKKATGDEIRRLLKYSADSIAENARLFAEHLYQNKNVQTYFVKSFLEIANNIHENILKKSDGKFSETGIFANTTTANTTTTSTITSTKQSAIEDAKRKPGASSQ